MTTRHPRPGFDRGVTLAGVASWAVGLTIRRADGEETPVTGPEP